MGVPILYTVKEVADTFKVTPMTVYRWIKAGKLTARLTFQPSGQIRITDYELKRFIRAGRK